MRLVGPDYLRGIVALLIMLYHYIFWISGKAQYSELLGKVGIYGVSIFYILSGFTLYFVYHNSLRFTVPSLRSFFLKRFFRLFPLLWLVISLTVLLESLLSDHALPSASQLLLNFSGLFGIYRVEQYLAVGSWSIGNELVFYLMFPFMLFFARKNLVLYKLALAVLLGLFIWYAYYVLSPEKTIKQQWGLYIEPLNQAFLFFSGFELARLCIGRRANAYAMLMIFGAALFLFWLIPYGRDGIWLVTGYRRLLLSVCCLSFCACAYYVQSYWHRLLDYPLRTLGDISYSLYLIHPIVWVLISDLCERWQLPGHYRLAGIPLSIALAWLSHRYYESYFMSLGRRLISKIPGES